MEANLEGGQEEESSDDEEFYVLKPRQKRNTVDKKDDYNHVYNEVSDDDDFEDMDLEEECRTRKRVTSVEVGINKGIGTHQVENTGIDGTDVEGREARQSERENSREAR